MDSKDLPDSSEPIESSEPSDSESKTDQDPALNRSASSSTPNDSKLGSLARETRSLLTDVKDWIDLRVQLLQIEVEERIESAAHKIISLIVVAILGLFAVLFLLLAIAEAVGIWLGHPSYGYIFVAVIMIILTWIVNRSRPKFSTKPLDENLTATETPEQVGHLNEGKKKIPEAVSGGTEL